MITQKMNMYLSVVVKLMNIHNECRIICYSSNSLVKYKPFVCLIFPVKKIEKTQCKVDLIFKIIQDLVFYIFFGKIIPLMLLLAKVWFKIVDNISSNECRLRRILQISFFCLCLNELQVSVRQNWNFYKISYFTVLFIMNLYQ